MGEILNATTAESEVMVAQGVHNQYKILKTMRKSIAITWWRRMPRVHALRENVDRGKPVERGLNSS